MSHLLCYFSSIVEGKDLKELPKNDLKVTFFKQEGLIDPHCILLLWLEFSVYFFNFLLNTCQMQ